MRKLLVFCAVALLAACINVDDFGDYWDKTTVDPALAGRWQTKSETDQNEAADQHWVFALRDNAYEVQTSIRGQTDDDGPIYPVKTLTVGPYLFLANGPSQGTIVRYKMGNNSVTFYVLNPKPAWAFIQANYPNQQNIYRDSDEGDDDQEGDIVDDESEKNAPDAAADADEAPLRIKVFDDQVYQILSKIPDTGVYWSADRTLERM
jgi:hypothetical protein